LNFLKKIADTLLTIQKYINSDAFKMTYSICYEVATTILFPAKSSS
jgi:hypothetical protein